MKVTVNQKVVDMTRFPRLMISDSGNIVLFESPGKGICLSEGTPRGKAYGTAWNMSSFRDFEGTVILKNED